jgi:hypothetical protein
MTCDNGFAFLAMTLFCDSDPGMGLVYLTRYSVQPDSRWS